MIGYDPQGVAELARLTHAAIDELDSTSCDNPYASDAIATIRSISSTLRETLLASLEGVLASTAMTTWDGAEPPSVVGLTAGRSTPTETRRGLRSGDAAIVAELDATIAAVIAGDIDAWPRLQQLVAEHGDDPNVMADVLHTIGPEGLVDLLVALSYGWAAIAGDVDAEQVREITDSFTAALADVGDAEGYSADGLATAFASRCAGEGAYFLGSSALAAFELVADSGHAPAGFELAFVTTAVAVERNSDLGTDVWAMQSGYDHGDVVTVALSRIADDPQAARALAGDPETLEYLSTRGYGDGCTAYWQLIEAATAGPDLRDPVNPPSDAIWEQASVIVSQATHWLTENPHFDPADVSAAASLGAARVAGTHILAIHHSVVEDGPGEPAGLDWRDVDLDHTRDVSVEGASVPVAALEPAGRDLLVDVAIADGAGLEALRADVGTFHVHRARGAAAMTTDLALNPELFSEAMEQSGRLEGYFVEHIGHQAERHGAALDQRFTFWADTLGSGGGELFGLVDGPISHMSVGVASLADGMAGELAHYEGDAIREAETNAMAAAERITYVYAAALVAEGVIDLPTGYAMPATLGEFERLPATVQDDFWNDVGVLHVDNEFRLDVTAVRDGLKEQQHHFYVEIRAATGD